MPARRESMGEETPQSSSSRGRGRDGGKEKESFGCPFPGCGQTYSRMEYLKRHQRKHQDVRPFQCKDCSKCFARSDVLLRHRRRCHPAPPALDRNSRSPPPPARAYPGVPVSSSRTDTHERSPARRKRPRQSSGGSATDNNNRRRVEEEEEEEDEVFGENFGENSRYPQPNEANHDIYDLNSNYYAQDPESATYTPHLLPMFQQQNQQNFHNLNDADHLEDASNLLSIAYAASTAANNDGNPTVGGQRVVPDWAAGQTINMMMENVGDAEGSRQDSLSGTSEPSASNGTLPEPMGNFLGTMSWLEQGGLQKDTSTSEDGSIHAWPAALPGDTSTKALSPFPLSSLFSPSAFGLSLSNTSSASPAEGDEENSQVVLSLLDTLAQLDAPQTKFNPNPERPMLRIEHTSWFDRMGSEAPKSSKFYLPADRFAGCYQIPHWALPPLRVLSHMASKTFNTVLTHFSFVHAPTFKLIDAGACLAFAICTVGGIRSNSSFNEIPSGRAPVNGQLFIDKMFHGPVPVEGSWEDIFQANFAPIGDQEDADKREVQQWRNAPIVRNEKTSMLVKSFSLAQGVLMTEYNVALLQALILYNAPYFLSGDESERALGNMSLGVIVNIARQIGFFNADLDHCSATINLPSEPYTNNDLDLHWRRWIQLETRRRTAFIVYHLDTVASLESSLQCNVSPADLAHTPLPASNALWMASTAEEWLAAAKKTRIMTLDEAMRRLFHLPTYGQFDVLHENADTKSSNLLNEVDLGPFARVTMVLTLLRGIRDIGEGKRDRGDWRDLTDLWVGLPWMKPGAKMLSSEGKDMGSLTREKLVQMYSSALQKWREGWDFDGLCPCPVAMNKALLLGSPPVNLSPGGTQTKAKPTSLTYCEEALPFYWLATALVNVLNESAPREPGYNSFGQVGYAAMLRSARTFTRMGEGVDNLTSAMSAASANLGLPYTAALRC